MKKYNTNYVKKYMRFKTILLTKTIVDQERTAREIKVVADQERE